MTLTTMTMLVFMMALFGFASQVGAYPPSCTNPKVGGGDASNGAVPDCTAKTNGKKNASCTPYTFQPATKAGFQDEIFWQDTSPWTTSPFVWFPPNNPSNGYQAYQYYDPSSGQWGEDIWILHAHDKAGVQAADCGGDVHYLEHFEGRGKQGTCNMYAEYPAQGQNGDDGICSFHHQGIDEYFQQYQCGWWRGYDNGQNAGFDGINHGGRAWNDMSVDPQNTPGEPPVKSQWDSAKYALNHCKNCPNGNDGTQHTFLAASQQPDVWFTGILWPWRCAHLSTGQPGGEYTGVKDTKCYCDNEPWGGRNNGSRVFNHNTQILYCGKYNNEDGMYCDLIEMKECDTIKSQDQGIFECQSSEITHKNFFLKDSSFP